MTTAWWKEERGEKVFIDYNQNARDRTIASAYSVRARPDAAVSAPVTWDELPDVETEDFTLVSMPARFASLGDVQAAIDDTVCDLGALLEWVEREEAAGVGKRRIHRTSPRCRASRLASSPRAAASPKGNPAPSSPCGVPGRQGRSRSPTVGPAASRGGRSSAHVHALGSLSGRKRSSLVPCRKRRPCTLS